MVGFTTGKIKRRDFEDVYDDFAEFSLSSPARKIRRLDAELPPIMEDTELGSSMVVHQLPKGQEIAGSSPVAEALPVYPPNEERAIVLYKRVENPLILYPPLPDVTFHVSSDLIHDLKSNVLKNKDRSAMSDDRLAVVPWVAPQASVSASTRPQIVPVDESMEAEETEATSMEVEDSEAAGNVVSGGGLHWQQHCMNPQHPPSTLITPIMWSR